MKCQRFGAAIICGPDAVGHSVQVNGKRVYFDFDRWSGPLLTNSAGDPLKRQPRSENYPFWGPFKVWLAEWRKANPERPAPAPTDHLDRSMSQRSNIFPLKPKDPRP